MDSFLEFHHIVDTAEYGSKVEGPKIPGAITKKKSLTANLDLVQGAPGSLYSVTTRISEPKNKK